MLYVFFISIFWYQFWWQLCCMYILFRLSCCPLRVIWYTIIYPGSCAVLSNVEKGQRLLPATVAPCSWLCILIPKIPLGSYASRYSCTVLSKLALFAITQWLRPHQRPIIKMFWKYKNEENLPPNRFFVPVNAMYCSNVWLSFTGGHLHAQTLHIPDEPRACRSTPWFLSMTFYRYIDIRHWRCRLYIWYWFGATNYEL